MMPVPRQGTGDLEKHSRVGKVVGTASSALDLLTPRHTGLSRQVTQQVGGLGCES